MARVLTIQLCANCRKRPALAASTHCFICHKHAAARMYRAWKREAKKAK